MPSPRDIARERVMRVLDKERVHLPPETLAMLRADIAEVLSQYAALADAPVEIELRGGGELRIVARIREMHKNGR